MKLLKEAWAWIGSFGIALAVALFIGIFVFQPYQVEGHSMDPTLRDQERVYVSKLPHSLSYVPDYGDIVIIDSRVGRDRTWKDDIRENPLLQLISGKSTERDHVYYVKRLIGKPGDTIEVKNQKVYRNGEALDEPYLNETMLPSADRTWTVPDKHIFVMGDNRNHSQDSREIGFIPLDHLMGKKLFH